MSHERDQEPTHEGPPRDERAAGDSAATPDEITPHDLPKGHPGRKEVERKAAESESGTARGNR